MYDIAIVGAGPAGLTAAIYALRMNKKILVFEAGSYGGQIANASEVGNYPGIASISGFEFATKLYQQAVELGMELVNGRVDKLKREKDFFTIYANGTSYEAKAVILATGVRRRLLNIPGEKEFKGLGVSYCATCDGAFFRKKDVAVIGGGNTALGEALHLSNVCNKVYLVHRRETFRGNQKSVDSVYNTPNIEIILNADLQEIIGTDTVDRLSYLDKKTGKVASIAVAGIFVAIGQEPDTGIVNGLASLDDGNYVIAREDCSTNVEGLFVAGDCRSKEIRQLTTATADGTVAAIKAGKYLE